MLWLEVWGNGLGAVKEVLRKEVTPADAGGSPEQGCVERNTIDDHDVVTSQSPYPANGQLDSTIDYLGWSIGHWGKGELAVPPWRRP
jgi:hypothetical protein